jgi:hypothetical protein
MLKKISLILLSTFLWTVIVQTQPAHLQDNPSAPILSVDVSPATAIPGGSVNVNLNLLNVTNIYGLDVECSVNPAVLAGATRADGEGFNSANSFFIDRGYQTDGTWKVGATRLQPNAPITGSVTAFTLAYTVQAVGSTDVTCTALGVDPNGQPVPLQVVNGSFNGAEPTLEPTLAPTIEATVEVTPEITLEPTVEATAEITPEVTIEPTIDVTPEITPESTVEVTPEVTPETTLEPTVEATAEVTPEITPESGLGTISGVIAYQNRPDNAGINVQLLTADGTFLVELTTNADGGYIFTDVPLGNYVIRVNAPQHLSFELPAVVETPGQVAELTGETLRAGDTDDNGLIDTTDATFIGANYGVAAPPAPANADLNSDGTVNISDLALVGSNYGLNVTAPTSTPAPTATPTPTE